MTLDDYRAIIDKIDADIVRLFEARMEVSENIAAYKRARSLSVCDIGRERALLARVADMAGAPNREFVLKLYALILELSKARQAQLNAGAPEGAPPA